MCHVRTCLMLLGWSFSVGTCGISAEAQPKTRPQRGSRLEPTQADVRYGPHERNVLDLYLAEVDEPTPLVLYIHGGGFRGGDKRSLNPGEGRTLLQAGFSIAAINYRLTDTTPAPAAYLDCGRALQFLRYHAEQWNLNPKLVASTGGSAGAGTSLWLAFHDDLADPNSEDPVARQSTDQHGWASRGFEVAHLGAE